MSELQRIEIPAEAVRVKADFQTEPDRDLIDEIKEHISRTGLPHTWRGHTHTRPPSGAAPKYIAEFSLPRWCKHRQNWAPCPCCCPEHPKYRHGFVAWFADEAVIRIIGHNCFRALNSEGHEIAIAEFRREERRRQEEQFLLRNLSIVPTLMDTLEANCRLAEALDAVAKSLRGRIEKNLEVPLWREIYLGELRVREVVSVPYRKRDGSEGTRVEERHRLYARIDGVRILDPGYKPLGPKLRSLSRQLNRIRFDNPEECIPQMDETERSSVAGTLSRTHTAGKGIVNELWDLRKFLGPTTLNTLRTWGQQEGRPFPFYIAHNGSSLYVGKIEEEKLRIELPEAINAEPVALPEFRSQAKV